MALGFTQPCSHLVDPHPLVVPPPQHTEVSAMGVNRVVICAHAPCLFTMLLNVDVPASTSRVRCGEIECPYSLNIEAWSALGHVGDPGWAVHLRHLLGCRTLVNTQADARLNEMSLFADRIEQIYFTECVIQLVGLRAACLRVELYSQFSRFVEWPAKLVVTHSANVLLGMHFATLQLCKHAPAFARPMPGPIC